MPKLPNIPPTLTALAILAGVGAAVGNTVIGVATRSASIAPVTGEEFPAAESHQLKQPVFIAYTGNMVAKDIVTFGPGPDERVVTYQSSPIEQPHGLTNGGANQ